MEFLVWLEDSGFGTAVREGIWAYPLIIVLHGMGMGTVVGISTMMGLRLLGFLPGIPLDPMKKLFTFVWLGFWINAASGGLLMVAHATEMFTNWVMYIKLASVALAILSIRLLQTHAFGNPHPTWPAPKVKMVAGTLLCLWAVAVTAGRLTAYYGQMIDSLDLIEMGLR